MNLRIDVTGLLAGPGGKSGGGNLINIDDDSTGASSAGQMTGQSKTQMLLEEEANLQELQDREKSIHQVRLLLSTFLVDSSTIKSALHNSYSYCWNMLNYKSLRKLCKDLP